MQTVIYTSRLRQNIRRFRAATRNELCAVVKADAYGHGLPVACYIEPLVDCFMVATADEAFGLSTLVHKPILTLGGDVSPYTRVFSPQVVPTVCDLSQLEAIISSGYKRFSIAINTGMNRLGANENTLAQMVGFCKSNDIKPWSVYSHLYSLSAAPEQSTLFARLTADPILQAKRHLYCSHALDLSGFDLFDMTRGGIALYGYHSDMNACMRVRAKIVALSAVRRGEHIGYGDVTLERDAVIATVRCGYADGLRRTHCRLYMRVRGEKCPVIGTPCMDLTMIDVTGLSCRVGEFAYLIYEKEDAEYLAMCYNTIVYEVLTGFNGRAERVYI